MRERLWLFDKFTRPSMEAQTSQNFEWLILGRPPLKIPIGVKHSFHVVDKGQIGSISYINYIKEVAKDEDIILMTRFDNDDMFMPSFVEDIQKIATQPNHIYEFKGYRLDLRNGQFYTDLVHHKECTSPFTTLVSTPGKDFKTIYSAPHADLWKRYQLHIDKKRNWVQIIHNTNWVLNTTNCEGVSHRGKLADEPEFVSKLRKLEAG